MDVGAVRRNSTIPCVDAVLRGWGVSGVHNVSSGNPINFTMGTDVALDGTGGAGRQLAQLVDGTTAEDVVRRDHSSKDDFIAAFFNTSAFVPVAQIPRGIYGNMPKRLCQRPGASQHRYFGDEDVRASWT